MAYPSLLGNRALLAKDEVWPKVAKIPSPAPLLESPPWLFRSQVMFMQSAGKIPQAASQSPA